MNTADLLDSYLASYDEWKAAQRKPSSGLWKASSLGKCLKAQYFERLGVPRTSPFDPKTIRIFQAGRMFEKFVADAYWRAGLMLAREPRFENHELQLVGHIDAVVGGSPQSVESIPPEISKDWTPEWLGFLDSFRGSISAPVMSRKAGGPPTERDRSNGFSVASVSGEGTEQFAASASPDPSGHLPVTVLEIKSMNSRAIERAYKEGPQPAHIYQLASYKVLVESVSSNAGDTEMTVGGELGIYPTPEAYKLTYVGKDSLGILEFDLDESYVGKVYDRLNLLNTSWAEGLPPDCSCSEAYNGKGPLFCGFRDPEFLEPENGLKGYKGAVPSCCDDALLGVAA